MPHPLMFDNDDPMLARLRPTARSLPGAAEKISHEHPAFFTTKVFAYFGGSIKVDGPYQQQEQTVVVKPDPPERAALVTDSRTYATACLSPISWIGLDLGDGTDWDEVAELETARPGGDGTQHVPADQPTERSDRSPIGCKLAPRDGVGGLAQG